jgi:SAM-dependent methyltransferase
MKADRMDEQEAGAAAAALPGGPSNLTSGAAGGSPNGRVRYPDYANPELLEKLPLGARTVLDTGSATGALGLAYLRRNPASRYLGIELDETDAAIAATRGIEMFTGNAEVDPLPFELPDGIDCLVYGDVLEHLSDPWALLRRQTEALRAGGTAVVCMPNVEHWSVALRLLNGSFDYQDAGILDRTHLRWFTPRTMGDALTQAGLELSDVSPRPTDTQQAHKFAQALAPGLAAIGVDPAEYFNRAGPIQFIWRARKISPPRIFINATMLAPLGGVSDVRIVEPQRALRTDSSVITAISAEPEMGAGLADTPRIAILHRPLLVGASGIARIRALLAKDYIVVTEFDDHPSFMAERGLDLSQLLSFSAVHAIQTSTPTLGEVLAAENPEVAVFANAIFELPEIRNFANPEQLTLVFAALNRAEDWAPLVGALNDVSRAVGRRLKFAVAHDRDFFDALDSPEKEFFSTLDYPAYLNLLASAEIAFMPLADTVFNRAKSDLKYIEASACRAVSVASRVVYGATIKDRETGLIFSDATELRAQLLRILAYPEAGRRIADAARSYVAGERMMAYQVAERTAWYRSLWERRDALNASLRERMPALFA